MSRTAADTRDSTEQTDSRGQKDHQINKYLGQFGIKDYKFDLFVECLSGSKILSEAFLHLDLDKLPSQEKKVLKEFITQDYNKFLGAEECFLSESDVDNIVRELQSIIRNSFVGPYQLKQMMKQMLNPKQMMDPKQMMSPGIQCDATFIDKLLEFPAAAPNQKKRKGEDAGMDSDSQRPSKRPHLAPPATLDLPSQEAGDLVKGLQTFCQEKCKAQFTPSRISPTSVSEPFTPPNWLETLVRLVGNTTKESQKYIGELQLVAATLALDQVQKISGESDFEALYKALQCMRCHKQAAEALGTQPETRIQDIATLMEKASAAKQFARSLDECISSILDQVDQRDIELQAVTLLAFAEMYFHGSQGKTRMQLTDGTSLEYDHFRICAQTIVTHASQQRSSSSELFKYLTPATIFKCVIRYKNMFSRNPSILQVYNILELLEHDGHTVLNAPVGQGKTSIFLTFASLYLEQQWSESILLAVNTGHDGDEAQWLQTLQLIPDDYMPPVRPILQKQEQDKLSDKILKSAPDSKKPCLYVVARTILSSSCQPITSKAKEQLKKKFTALNNDDDFKKFTLGKQFDSHKCGDSAYKKFYEAASESWQVTAKWVEALRKSIADTGELQQLCANLKEELVGITEQIDIKKERTITDTTTLLMHGALLEYFEIISDKKEILRDLMNRIGTALQGADADVTCTDLLKLIRNCADRLLNFSYRGIDSEDIGIFADDDLRELPPLTKAVMQARGARKISITATASELKYADPNYKRTSRIVQKLPFEVLLVPTANTAAVPPADRGRLWEETMCAHAILMGKENYYGHDPYLGSKDDETRLRVTLDSLPFAPDLDAILEKSNPTRILHPSLGETIHTTLQDIAMESSLEINELVRQYTECVKACINASIASIKSEVSQDQLLEMIASTKQSIEDNTRSIQASPDTRDRYIKIINSCIDTSLEQLNIKINIKKEQVSAEYTYAEGMQERAEAAQGYTQEELKKYLALAMANMKPKLIEYSYARERLLLDKIYSEGVNEQIDRLIQSLQDEVITYDLTPDKLIDIIITASFHAPNMRAALFIGSTLDQGIGMVKNARIDHDYHGDTSTSTLKLTNDQGRIFHISVECTKKPAHPPEPREDDAGRRWARLRTRGNDHPQQVKRSNYAYQLIGIQNLKVQSKLFKSTSPGMTAEMTAHMTAKFKAYIFFILLRQSADTKHSYMHDPKYRLCDNAQRANLRAVITKHHKSTHYVRANGMLQLFRSLAGSLPETCVRKIIAYTGEMPTISELTGDTYDIPSTAPHNKKQKQQQQKQKQSIRKSIQALISEDGGHCFIAPDETAKATGLNLQNAFDIMYVAIRLNFMPNDLVQLCGRVMRIGGKSTILFNFSNLFAPVERFARLYERRKDQSYAEHKRAALHTWQQLVDINSGKIPGMQPNMLFDGTDADTLKKITQAINEGDHTGFVTLFNKLAARSLTKKVPVRDRRAENRQKLPLSSSAPSSSAASSSAASSSAASSSSCGAGGAAAATTPQNPVLQAMVDCIDPEAIKQKLIASWGESTPSAEQVHEIFEAIVDAEKRHLHTEDLLRGFAAALIERQLVFVELLLKRHSNPQVNSMTVDELVQHILTGQGFIVDDVNFPASSIIMTALALASAKGLADLSAEYDAFCNECHQDQGQPSDDVHYLQRELGIARAAPAELDASFLEQDRNSVLFARRGHWVVSTANGEIDPLHNGQKDNHDSITCGLWASLIAGRRYHAKTNTEAKNDIFKYTQSEKPQTSWLQQFFDSIQSISSSSEASASTGQGGTDNDVTLQALLLAHYKQQQTIRSAASVRSNAAEMSSAASRSATAYHKPKPDAGEKRPLEQTVTAANLFGTPHGKDNSEQATKHYKLASAGDMQI
jgi:hypothetical protein